MKRRNFIISASVVAVGLPVAYYLKKQWWQPDPLTTPDLLGKFCKEGELREIGARYRELVPVENEKQKLTDLILTDDKSQKLKTSDKLRITEFINAKIHDEFVADKTIIIKGWFISITEARQCALLSLQQNQA